MKKMRTAGIMRVLLVWIAAAALLCANAAIAEAAVWVEETDGIVEAIQMATTLNVMEREDNSGDADDDAKLSGPAKLELHMGKPMPFREIFTAAEDAAEIEVTAVDEKIVKVGTDENGGVLIPVAPGETKVTAQIKGDVDSLITIEVEVVYSYKLNMPEYIFIPGGANGVLIKADKFEPAGAPQPVCTWKVGDISVDATWIKLGFDNEPSVEEITITPPNGESVTLKFVVYNKINSVALNMPMYGPEDGEKKVDPPIVGRTMPTSVVITADDRVFTNPTGAYKIVSETPDLVTVNPDGSLKMTGSGEASVRVDLDIYQKTKSGTHKFNIMKTVVLPEGIKTIEEETLAGDSAIEAVYIPYGCESIGKGAFKGCDKLKVVYIPLSVTSIAENAFKGCPDEMVVIANANMMANILKDGGLTDNIKILE